MSVDLDKNKENILKVYNYVLDDKSKTNWALFGYEGQTNVLKVVAYGDEGIEELADDLNASKIMYAVLKVSDPKTLRTKIVLINWRGEGAPNIRKGICARHLPDVKNFLKGVHITVNARTEEEVDNSLIMDAISKATSTDYNFSDRSEISEKNVPVKNLVNQFRSGETNGSMNSHCMPSLPSSSSYNPNLPIPINSSPVVGHNINRKNDSSFKNHLGTNYRRTNPQSEIDTNSRNKFWEEQEAEEKVRKDLELRKREEDARLLEKERVEREARDLKHRDELNKERNARIIAEKKAENAVLERAQKQRENLWEKERENQYNEEIERAKRAEYMRSQRKKEAENIIGNRTNDTRSMFESQTTNQNSFNQVDQRNKPPPKVLREFNPTNGDNSNNKDIESSAKRTIGARWPPASNEQETVYQPSTVPGKITEWKPQEFREQSTNSQSFYNKESVEFPKNSVERCRSQFQQDQNSSWQSTTSHKTEKTPTHQMTQNVHQFTENSHQPSIHEFASTTHQSTSNTHKLSTSNTHQLVTSNTHQMATSNTHQLATSNTHQLVTSNTHQLATSNTHQLATSSIQESTPNIQGSNPSNEHKKSYNNDQMNGVEYNMDQRFYSNGVVGHSDNSTIALHSEQHPSQDDIDSFSMLYEVDGVEYQILPEHGLCARALYDYQAADETEITFDPGDIITNIDQIDVGWWQGVSSLGVFGLFPANYVELINGTKSY